MRRGPSSLRIGDDSVPGVSGSLTDQSKRECLGAVVSILTMEDSLE